MVTVKRVKGFLYLKVIGTLVTNDVQRIVTEFRLASSEGQFLVITDVSEMSLRPSPILLIMFSEGIKGIDGLTKNWIADAIVVKAMWVQFVVSTLVLIAPMPTKVEVFRSMQDAKDMCLMAARSVGLTPAPELMHMAA